MADTATLRTRNADFWTRAAPGWINQADRHDDLGRPLGAAALDWLRPQPGERVLDVGCGCGGTTAEIARAVAPQGRAVGRAVWTVALPRRRYPVRSPSAAPARRSTQAWSAWSSVTPSRWCAEPTNIFGTFSPFPTSVGRTGFDPSRAGETSYRLTEMPHLSPAPEQAEASRASVDYSRASSSSSANSANTSAASRLPASARRRSSVVSPRSPASCTSSSAASLLPASARRRSSSMSPRSPASSMSWSTASRSPSTARARRSDSSGSVMPPTFSSHSYSVQSVEM